MYKSRAYNYHFFDSIDDEIKAYWLGFIQADGCVMDKRVIVDCHRKDAAHLLTFCKHIQLSERPIRLQKHSRATGGKNLTMCRVDLGDKRVVSAFHKLEFTNRKSRDARFVQKLSAGLVSHYIRGLFDGDGSVSYDRNGRVTISITGTKNICKGVLTQVGMGTVTTDKTAYRWRLSGIKNAVLFMQYLYAGTSVYLPRKHRVFLRIQAHQEGSTDKRLQL